MGVWPGLSLSATLACAGSDITQHISYLIHSLYVFAAERTRRGGARTSLFTSMHGARTQTERAPHRSARPRRAAGELRYTPDQTRHDSQEERIWDTHRTSLGVPCGRSLYMHRKRNSSSLTSSQSRRRKRDQPSSLTVRHVRTAWPVSSRRASRAAVFAESDACRMRCALGRLWMVT